MFEPEVSIVPLYSSQGAYADPGNTMAGDMEMIHVFTSSEATAAGNGAAEGINHGYRAGSSNYYQSAKISANTDDWRFYKVQVKVVDDEGYTAADIVQLLAGNRYTLSVGQTAESNSQAVFYSLGTTDLGSGAGKTFADAAPTASTQGVSNPAAFSTNITLTAEYQNWYFGMYVEGERNSVDAAVTGNFTVTLSQNA